MNFLNYNYFKGNKKAILFIHGDLQNQTVFKNYENIFQKKGHTTLSFDLPGHGNSAPVKNPEEIYNVLKNLIKEKQLQKPIIIGHSLGGVLGSQYAANTKNTSGLILISSLTSSPVEDTLKEKIKELKNYYLNLSKTNFEKIELIDYSKKENLTEEKIQKIGLQLTSPEAFENNIDYLSNIKSPSLDSLNMPILFIYPNEDPFTSEEKMNSQIKTLKNAKKVSLKGGHNLHLTNKKELEKILLENYDFLLGQTAE